MAPWKGYDLPTIQQIGRQIGLKLQLSPTSYEMEYPLIFEIESYYNIHRRPLDWLTVQVLNLNLTGFALPDGSTVKDFYEPPHLQCLYCGQLDVDKRGKPFNKKSHFCHVSSCDTSSPDMLKDHGEGCCKAEWHKIKKHVRQRLERSKNQEHIEFAFTEFLQKHLAHLKQANKIPVRFY